MGAIKLLLAEDDETLGYLLKEYLGLYSFSVSWFKNGEEAWAAFKKDIYDIAVLDVMMPQKDGMTLLDDIKKENIHFPVIILTSKSLKIDKLKCFKLGADDYIVKPVDEEELVARINAVLRRSGKYTVTSTDVFTVGQYEFDFAKQTLLFDKTVLINISRREAELLKEFCLNVDEMIERRVMLKQFWGKNDYFTRKSMDVFIHRLRTHLSKDEYIKLSNVHGKGYILSIKERSLQNNNSV